jgi:hypothetical protein
MTPNRNVRGAGFPAFRKRLEIVPFETALAVAAVWSGGSALLGWTVQGQALEAILPHWLAGIFSITYLLAGAGLLTGIGLAYRNIETAALVLLLSSLAIRVVAGYTVGGFSPAFVQGTVQAVVFIPACAFRIKQLARGVSIVQTENIPVLTER